MGRRCGEEEDVLGEGPERHIKHAQHLDLVRALCLTHHL